MTIASPLSIDEFLRPIVASALKAGGFEHWQQSATTLRLDVLSEKIELAAALSLGWDSYNAPPPNEPALANARRALAVARDLLALPSTITPAVDGGIALCWDSSPFHAYVEFDNDGSAVIAMYDETTETYVSEFNPEQHLCDAVGTAHNYIRRVGR